MPIRVLPALTGRELAVKVVRSLLRLPKPPAYCHVRRGSTGALRLSKFLSEHSHSMMPPAQCRRCRAWRTSDRPLSRLAPCPTQLPRHPQLQFKQVRLQRGPHLQQRRPSPQQRLDRQVAPRCLHLQPYLQHRRPRLQYQLDSQMAVCRLHLRPHLQQRRPLQHPLDGPVAQCSRHLKARLLPPLYRIRQL